LAEKAFNTAYAPWIACFNKISKLLILLALKIPVSAVRFSPWAPFFNRLDHAWGASVAPFGVILVAECRLWSKFSRWFFLGSRHPGGGHQNHPGIKTLLAIQVTRERF
jgi:hypothetical protein